jgi:hypothetical protein
MSEPVNAHVDSTSFLLLEGPAREEAEVHARDCVSCADAIAGARDFTALLECAAPRLSDTEVALVTRVKSELLGAMEEPVPVVRRIAVAAGVLVACAVLVVFATHRNPGMWTQASVLATGAAMLAALSHVRAGVRLAATLASSLASAWISETSSFVVSGAVSGAVSHHAAACVLTELAAAAVPVLLTTRLTRSEQATALGLAATAGAGALAGQAALLLTCPSHEQGHMVIVHFGGVVACAIAGAIYARRAAGRAAA